MRSNIKLRYSFLLTVLLFFSFSAKVFAECTLCDVKTSLDDLNGKVDKKNSEIAQAIINYLAQIEQDRYTLLVKWHTDPAPGTDRAMTAGQNLGKIAYSDSVILAVGNKLVASFVVAPSDGSPQKTIESEIATKFSEYLKSTSPINPLTPAQKVEQLSAINFSQLYQKSVIISEGDRDNVDLLARLIADPFAKIISDKSSPEDIANAAVEKATASVSLNAFMEMIAKRNPSADTQNKSLLQIMEEESSWRMKDVKWFQNISVSSQEAVLREIAQMMAFNMWMNYQQYRQNEQITALMAASVSSQARLVNMMAVMSKTLGNAQAEVDAAKAQAEAASLPIKD